MAKITKIAMNLFMVLFEIEKWAAGGGVTSLNDCTSWIVYVNIYCIIGWCHLKCF
jgi:hypothetical protein